MPRLRFTLSLNRMCLAVYLASSAEMPAHLRGDRDAPVFYLEAVPASAPVRKQFTVPHVYYAGSHQGCGCGFLKEGVVDEELARTQADYDARAECIRAVQTDGATIELFACWEGDHGDAPDFSETRSVEGIREPLFAFGEGHFVSVR